MDDNRLRYPPTGTGEEREHRQPPYNIPVEQALLGAILVNNKAFDRVARFLQPEHFFEPAHGRLYLVMTRLIERGKLASPVTMAHFFERDEGLEDVGGTQYLARLAASVVSVLDAEDYGRVIHDLAMRRNLIAVAEKLLEQGYNPQVEHSAAEMAGEATAQLDQAAFGVNSGAGQTLFIAAMDAAQASLDIANGQGEKPISTGFYDLDNLLAGGMHRQQYLLLAGRPSMGKSAFALSIVLNVAAEGHRVAYISLEMSNKQNAERALGAISDTVYVEIMKGQVDAAENVGRALPRMQEAWSNVWMYDQGGQTIEQIRSTVNIEHRRKPFRLLVIDSLELVADSPHTRNDQRVYRLKHVSNTVLAMCKSLDIPVLALHQLSRNTERRDDKRPHLADLRDSGSLEQDAHTAMFIYREWWYLNEAGPKDNDDRDSWAAKCADTLHDAEILIRKNRMGATGDVRLWVDLPTNRFKSAS